MSEKQYRVRGGELDAIMRLGQRRRLFSTLAHFGGAAMVVAVLSLLCTNPSVVMTCWVGITVVMFVVGVVAGWITRRALSQAIDGIKARDKTERANARDS